MNSLFSSSTTEDEKFRTFQKQNQEEKKRNDSETYMKYLQNEKLKSVTVESNVSFKKGTKEESKC